MRYKKKEKVILANDFTLLQDDREKRPWTFLSEIWPMETKRLWIGDYTIKGFEDKIAIEKKSGIKELLTNLNGVNRKTFKYFLEKLSTIPIKCIIVEEPLNSSQVYSVVKLLQKKSKNHSKLTADTIFYWTAYITIKYNIPMIYADKYTVKRILPNIIKTAYQKVSEI